MISYNILTTITIFWLTVCVDSSPDIQQSPEHLLLTMEQKEAKLSCRHGDTSYQYMYWYQQKSSGSLELIGMLRYKAPTIENKFNSNFQITGDAAKDGFLHVSKISSEDNAVYFCAASMHSHSHPHNP